MDSFRNRLLALIIGLVVATQSVTLVAVLQNTKHEAQVQADERLRSGSQVVEEYMRSRAAVLSSSVTVLAADFGLREAVASRDEATILSVANNHSQRIGADLVVFMDTGGRLLASSAANFAAQVPKVAK